MISVVVCTRNRQQQAEKCISSLVNQSLKPDEIVIVDDASEKPLDLGFIGKIVPKNVREQSKIDVKYIRNQKRQGTVKSRNLGTAAATGDIIAFIDDDAYAHKDWLSSLSKHYKRGSVLGVGGSVVEVGRKVETNPIIKKLSYITRWGDIKHNFRVTRFSETKKLPTRNVRFLMGGNMSFRRSALLKARGFDPRYKGNFYREETDLCMRIARSGKIVFDPSAAVYHNTAGGDVNRVDKFLYWYFRNTGLFFILNFGRAGWRKIYYQSKKYLKDLAAGKALTNRNYLITTSLLSIGLAIVTGSIIGVLIGLLFGGPIKKLAFKHPEYAVVMTLVLASTGMYVIDQKTLVDVAKQLKM